MCEAQQPASVQDQLVTKRREQNKGKFDLHALMTMGGLDEALEVAKRILEQQSCLDKEANITTPCNKPLEGKVAKFLLQILNQTLTFVDPPGHSRLRRAAASKVAKSRIPVPKKQKNPPKLATTNPSIESYENDVESTNLDNTCPDCLYCKLPAAKVQPRY